MMDGRESRLDFAGSAAARRLGALLACLALAAGAAELHGPGQDHGWLGPDWRAEGGLDRPAGIASLGTADAADRSPCHACLHRLHAQSSPLRAASLAEELPRASVAVSPSPRLRSRVAAEPWSSRGPPA